MTAHPPVPPAPELDIRDQSVVWSGRSTLRLVNFRHRRFDGAWSEPLTWELWQRGQAAAILPYDPITDQVVLIEQYRLPAHAAGMPGVMREIPAGLCEPGETPEASVRRELHEEAGLVARRIHRIGTFILAPGGSDETIHLYVGEVSAPRPERANDIDLSELRDSTEDIRILVQPAQQAIDEALEGAMPNAVAALTLLWFAASRPALRARWQ